MENAIIWCFNKKNQKVKNENSKYEFCIFLRFFYAFLKSAFKLIQNVFKNFLKSFYKTRYNAF